MTKIITHPDQITPDWISKILHQYGFSYDLQVTEIQTEQAVRPKGTSRTFLNLSFLGKVAPEAPQPLLLKLPGASSQSKSH